MAVINLRPAGAAKTAEEGGRERDDHARGEKKDDGEMEEEKE